MKHYVATIHLAVRAESHEALHYLVDTVVERLNKKPPGVRFEDVGTAQLRKALKARVRPTRKTKSRKR